MKDEVKGAAGKVLSAIRERKAVLIVLAVGLLLLLLPTGSKTEKAPPEQTQSPETQEETDLEERLEAMLSLIDGAGQVRVLLTEENDGERVLATDTQVSGTDRDGETSREESASAVVVSKGSGVSDPVEVKRVYPEYRGAVVAAQGADSAAVRLALLQAVSAATGLSGDCISIVKMK